MVAAGPGHDGARRPLGAYAVGALALVWVLLAVALLAIIGLEAVAGSDLDCVVPGVDSVYGEAAWQWWPPGQVCAYGEARYRAPGSWRAWAIGVEVVLGGGLAVLWWRSRRAPDPDWAT